MGQMLVKPPAAAAREPVSMVSACSKPGSRKCTCISMKPGVTMSPVASKISAAGAERFAPTPRMRPSSIHTSTMASWPEAGSMTRPFLMSNARIVFYAHQHLFQHRHSHGDAVFHLRQNHRALRVRDFRRDFAASINGTGVHDDYIRLGQAQVFQAQ